MHTSLPGGSKNVLPDKKSFLDNRQRFFYRNFRTYSRRSSQQFLKISPKYFRYFKNYSFDNILFRTLFQKYTIRLRLINNLRLIKVVRTQLHNKNVVEVKSKSTLSKYKL